MPQTQSVLMQNIQRSANAIGRINPNSLRTSLTGKDQAEALMRLCGVCLDDIASALKQDEEPGETIAVPVCGQAEPHTLTLAQCQAWCLNMKKLAGECVYRFRIQQALLQANVWVRDLREPGSLSEEQMMFAAETGVILVQVLQDALAAGVSEDMRIELNEEPVSLAQVRQLGLYVAAAANERNTQ